jgi:hypothetical protein
MKTQKGNALFLILIAVVLFAALSYAITQSNRSGGNVSSEAASIVASTVTQYPNAISAGLTRMLLRGVTLDQITFNDPENFNSGAEEFELFHPNGGGVAWQRADPNSVEPDPNNNNLPMGSWTVKSGYDVVGIGTGATDVVAVLTHVRKSVCEAINLKVTGSKNIPVLASVNVAQKLNNPVTIDGNGCRRATLPVRHRLYA